MIKSFFRWGFFKFCRDTEWEIYKNNIRDLLAEQERAFVRNLLTRVDGERLRETILKSDRKYESVLSIVLDSFLKDNYYDKSTLA
jgi:hypothetical protein